MLIHSGRACVRLDGRNLQSLDPGQFIGSISFITDETAPTDIVALEPTRYFRWPKSKLKGYLRKNPDSPRGHSDDARRRPHAAPAGQLDAGVTHQERIARPAR